ncbi:MAG: hypothetical protein EOP53_18025 [Sphingobacteriales bacterium]|nr:MAG: hypothetical protein EOP53_18025 [Sphingobacteriales bacterium]
MLQNIHIVTSINDGKPCLQILLQHATMPVVLSIIALDGTLLRLIAIPCGKSVINLDRVEQPEIHIKIETSHQTVVRRINIMQPEQEIML